MTDADQTPSFDVTPAAAADVLSLRSSEADAGSLALWVEVAGTNGDSYTYDIYFQALTDAAPGDWQGESDGLPIVVPAASIDRLNGAVLDVDGEGDARGMVIKNPNRPPASPAVQSDLPAPDLSGDVAQRVIQVLEQQINPAIAAHGGRADLVAVEEGSAYLRLSGGCAGCGMASVTLSQGIEVTLRELIPEVTRVVDVTDHASGTNPYYEPAKK
ncbi:MAG: NifU family protein [Actinomycetota bacterium]|jgi:Fe/S biogenesis protein NfuA|nr:NifU family protein [Actinomycetota bacterium]MDA8294358.1 NifU family protein [Actinomycetota bacterium]